uniref:Uncharacterized protein n=1 Tax=Meloidogyne hapla TaxID=6305 RepID=A0A1I8BYS3_MELHA
MHSFYLAFVLLFAVIYEIDCVKTRSGKESSGGHTNRDASMTRSGRQYSGRDRNSEVHGTMEAPPSTEQQLNEQSALFSNLSIDPQQATGVGSQLTFSNRELRAMRRSRNRESANPGTHSLHAESRSQRIGGSGNAAFEFHEDETQHNQEQNIGHFHQVEHGESSRGTEFRIRNVDQHISGPHYRFVPPNPENVIYHDVKDDAGLNLSVKLRVPPSDNQQSDNE